MKGETLRIIMLETWLNNLYNDTTKKWKTKGKSEKGFAIFYSPVIMCPKIMIIGYNPGGGKESFNENEISIPTKHDYVVGDYRLARNMRKIFNEVKSRVAIEETVKTNMIFFRSKKANDISNNELIEYSKNKTREIIGRLKPQNIITEGFKTFDCVMSLLEGSEQHDIIQENNEKRIIRIGIINGRTKVIGLIHPSGARGVSNDILKLMGKYIYKQIKL